MTSIVGPHMETVFLLYAVVGQRAIEIQGSVSITKVPWILAGMSLTTVSNVWVFHQKIIEDVTEPIVWQHLQGRGTTVFVIHKYLKRSTCEIEVRMENGESDAGPT